jgi:hypothetical protein
MVHNKLLSGQTASSSRNRRCRRRNCNRRRRRSSSNSVSSLEGYHQHHAHITLAVPPDMYVRNAHQRRFCEDLHSVVLANGPVLVPSQSIATQFVMHSGSFSSSVCFHARPSFSLQALYAGNMHQLRPAPMKSVHCVNGP